MPTAYAVLGAGRQGTAAAYDMARWGGARRVILADYDLEAARRAAERVNKLLGKTIAEPAQVDVTDLEAVERVLTGVNAFLSAVPYFYGFEITQVAIRVGAHMCDLGDHTGIARQHGFDAEARAAGISIIPNCGQVPGMGTTLMVYSMELLPRQVVWREAEAETRQALEAIKATDRLIDRIVYQLYGLTEEEIAVVEGRLKHE